jgi:hypothetical protein
LENDHFTNTEITVTLNLVHNVYDSSVVDTVVSSAYFWDIF